MKGREDNRVQHAARHGVRDQRAGREGSHAAGVRPLVAVERPLVILRRRQDPRAHAIGQDEERGLAPAQELLDDHPCSGAAEAAVDHHVPHGGLRLPAVGRDDDPLAGGQTVGLDDHRVAEAAPAQHVKGVGRARARGVAGGGNAAVGHQALRKGLAGFDLGRRPGRAAGAAASGGQLVHEAGRQGALRTDDGQVDPLALDEGQDVGGAAGVHGGAAGLARDAGVAGRTEEVVDACFLAELPAEGMLAGPGTHHEDAHDGDPVLRRFR